MGDRLRQIFYEVVASAVAARLKQDRPRMIRLPF